MKLRNKIFSSYLIVIFIFALCLSVFGFFIIQKYIVERAQDQVKEDLKTARTAYNEQFDLMRASFALINDSEDLSTLKKKIGLDYLFAVSSESPGEIKTILGREALKQKRPVFGTRIISPEELQEISSDLFQEKQIDIRQTLKAKPIDQKSLNSVMSVEYAKPLLDSSGRITDILYGGRIINKNFGIIDQIFAFVFEKKTYHKKPVGTVTVFQGDVRVATNVLDETGKRAVGTRVSDVVRKNVLEKGEKWIDRAFVVTDWYLTAYEPIKNIQGDIVGILYVGILEKPFKSLQRDIFFVFLGIVLFVCFLAGLFSLVLSRSMTQPLTQIVKITRKISYGDFTDKIKVDTNINELNDLTVSFNHMLERLSQQKKELENYNDKLAEMNRRYIDLIGFVSHELKGILSSIVLNVYLFQKGILGEINEKQKDVLKSIARNLDYLTVTVKNFLNLSRLEKSELKINKTELSLRDHVFNIAEESFYQQACEKNMKVEVDIPGELTVQGDPGLLQIVANNLLSNAIKYGQEGGVIRISSKEENGVIVVDVYNDGKPIDQVDIDKLFKKFSRIIYRGMEKVKGTGIGLFITKEILEKHGGEIWVEPRKEGNSFKFTISKA